MIQTNKKSYKTGNFPLFSLKMRHLGYKSPQNWAKTPPAITIHRGNFFPKKFTGKEHDSETGLYYYGARYLDSKTSRWLSGDPAMGEYVPEAPVDDEAKKRNQNLPGMGGVFNYVNLHVYHYAGNNPVKYTDPDGRDLDDFINAIEDTKVPDTISRMIDLDSAYRSEDATQKELDAATENVEGIFNNIKNNPLEHFVTGALVGMGVALYHNNETINNIVQDGIDFGVDLNNVLLSAGFDILGSNINLGIGQAGEYNMNYDISLKNGFSFTTENIFSFDLSRTSNISAKVGFGVNIRSGNVGFNNLNIGVTISKRFY